MLASPRLRPVEHVLVVRCAAPRASIWRYLADTQLLNMEIKSAPLEVSKVTDQASANRYMISTQVAGIPVRYREEPWQWAETRVFSLRRDMESGPSTSFSLRYDLKDLPTGGTEVTIRSTLTVRHPIFWPIVWLVSRRELKRVARYVQTIDESIAKQTPIQPVRAPGDPARAEKALTQLRAKHDRELVEKLRDHVFKGPDYDVLRIRPFELARTWKQKREDVVRLCLDSVGAGILELRWAIICPSCQTVSDILPSLRELQETAHCHSCDIQFGMDLSRAVEATFAPHPSIRVVEGRPFCIAGPMLTPHVMAQALVSPGKPGSLAVSGEAGRYRLFARGGQTAVVDAAAGKPDRVRVLLDKTGLKSTQIDVAPGGEIEVASDDRQPCHVKLERILFNFDALTALYVSTMPEFRAQFGGEALRPGLALKVGKVAVYFSDLCGSTALYSKVGDASAFGVVTDCLSFGTAIVEKNGGALVKTMGDAVMATFADVSNAIAAAAETVLAWEAFQKAHPLARDLDIKVGVAAGPCTIVTANGVLDYFGQTVNTAARVQHLAGARELVVSRDLMTEAPPGMRVIERFEAQVKGIVEPLSLVRLGPS